MGKERKVDGGRWVRQYCECCAVKQYKNERRRRRNSSLSPTYTAIAMLVVSSSISIFLFLEDSYSSSRSSPLLLLLLPVMGVQAASSRPNNNQAQPYARDGSRSRSRMSYHSPVYFSEEERILSALAETENFYENDDYDDDDDNYEMADYSTESPLDDIDIDVYGDVEDVDRNDDNEYSRRPNNVPTIVRDQTQYFQSPTRGENRRQNSTATTTTRTTTNITLLPGEEKTLQELREEALRQKAALEYVSVPQTHGVNTTTTSVKRAEPAAAAAAVVADPTTPWVRQFMASCPKDVLLPVPRDYILDNFNLAQLAPVVEKIALQNSVESCDPSGRSHPIYKQALRLILQEEPSDPDPDADADDVTGTVTVPDTVQRAAKVLYLLVHQRYVLSPRGLDTVRRRFLLKQSAAVGVDHPIFGRCPRVVCQGMPLLPFGDSDNFQVHDEGGRDSRAKRYCPSCGEGFYHWDSKVDGCAWGTSFCHLFVLTCGDEVFSEWKRLSLGPSSGTVVPRIFGFGLHPSIEKRRASW